MLNNHPHFIPFYLKIERFEKCEKLLIALEMAGWLNDQHIALQVVVQIYGLLSPIMFWKYPIHAALEVNKL